MTSLRIAIVGAGLAGLACARVLVEGGLSPVILEKSRGVGGRLATRRADGGLQFNHGAPYLTATDPDFAALLAEAEAGGAASKWRANAPAASDAGPWYVGQPGMSGFARHLCRDLDIRTGVSVSAVSPEGQGWRVTTADQSQHFDGVILTLPAPQVLRLLGPDNVLAEDLSSVRMSPCLTLMAAFAGQVQSGRTADAVPATELGLVMPETSKPGRESGLQSFVAHATADFSRLHLERDVQEIAGLMLPLLCDHIGRRPSEAVHAVAHRWRYALVDRALGRPFLADHSNRLFLGGDWCLGKAAQDAWMSGRAIARDLLSR